MKKRRPRVRAAVRLYVYGVSAREWTRRYGVEPFVGYCYDCNAPRETTIPFVQGTLRGLAAPPCPCGSTSETYGLVRDPKYGDLFDGDLNG